MMHTVDLEIDVTHAGDWAEPARIAASVMLPDPALLPDRPLVCFAKPGGGYSRGYFTHALPGPGAGAQAEFHAQRGWIFVALDNLGSGASSQHPPRELDITHAVSAAQAAEEEILLRLANGVLDPDFPPVPQPVRLGIGQSVGALLTIVQQARHASYDGIASLGYSALHSHPPTPPGEPPIVTSWFSRDLAPEQPGGVLNAAAVAKATAGAPQDAAWASLAWSFHYDDVPPDVVEQDLAHYEAIVAGNTSEAARDPAPWLSFTTTQEAARFVLTPGAIASEAAAVSVPVLAGMGERDLVVDPLGEARAFRSAASFDLFVCPRMGHMHNFAGTRALLWERIHHFGAWCAAAKGRL
ncbi:MAG: hypothetical protein JF593_01345 [Novosphingobium sp.]|nr:hypothetical protein [Novosphingobium sp.]